MWGSTRLAGSSRGACPESYSSRQIDTISSLSLSLLPELQPNAETKEWSALQAALPSSDSSN